MRGHISSYAPVCINLPTTSDVLKCILRCMLKVVAILFVTLMAAVNAVFRFMGINLLFSLSISEAGMQQLQSNKSGLAPHQISYDAMLQFNVCRMCHVFLGMLASLSAITNKISTSGWSGGTVAVVAGHCIEGTVLCMLPISYNMQLCLPLKFDVLRYLLSNVHQAMHRIWLRHHCLLAVMAGATALSTVIPIPFMPFLYAWGLSMVKSLLATVMSRQLILTLLVIGCVEVSVLHIFVLLLMAPSNVMPLWIPEPSRPLHNIRTRRAVWQWKAAGMCTFFRLLIGSH